MPLIILLIQLFITLLSGGTLPFWQFRLVGFSTMAGGQSAYTLDLPLLLDLLVFQNDQLGNSKTMTKSIHVQAMIPRPREYGDLEHPCQTIIPFVFPLTRASKSSFVYVPRDFSN